MAKESRGEGAAESVGAVGRGGAERRCFGQEGQIAGEAEEERETGVAERGIERFGHLGDVVG